MALELNAASAVTAWIGSSLAQGTIIANAVEARIGNYCHRMTQGVGVGTIWTTGSRTEFLSGELSDGVLLKWTPITAVASVTQITGNGTGTTYTLTDLTVDGIEIADLGTINARTGLLQMRVGVGMWDTEYLESRRARVPLPNFGAGRSRIKVVYTGGYSTIPDDLKLAGLTLAKNVYDAKSVNATLQSETLGNYSYTNSSGTESSAAEDNMGQVKDLLQNYRSYANILQESIMGTVGSIVYGVASQIGSSANPSSIETNWVQCHDNLEETADAASVYLKPYNSAKTTFHWVKTPAGSTRVLVRGKVDALATTIAIPPAIAIIGAYGADPSTTTNNFSGTVNGANWAKYFRIDDADSNAAGKALVLNVTTAGFEDSLYVYGDPYDLTGFDCKGARYVGLMVITAASVTGGAVNVPYGEFAFLN